MGWHAACAVNGMRWLCFWHTGATGLPFQVTRTIPNMGVASFQGSLCDESHDRPKLQTSRARRNRLLSTVSRFVFEDGLHLLQVGSGRGGIEEARAFEGARSVIMNKYSYVYSIKDHCL